MGQSPANEGYVILAGIMFPTAFFAASAFGVRGLCPLTGRLSKVEADPRKQGGGGAEAGTNFPTAFFLRLSPIGGSG